MAKRSSGVTATEFGGPRTECDRVASPSTRGARPFRSMMVMVSAGACGTTRCTPFSSRRVLSLPETAICAVAGRDRAHASASAPPPEQP